MKIIFRLLLILIASTISLNLFAKEVNVYSYRQPILIDPFFEEFTKSTGIKVNVLHAKKGLLERVLAEGEDTPADLVLTVDIARLNQFVEKDILQPINSDILNMNIPNHLRDSNNKWFALSKRARIVAISKERVSTDSIKRIEDLSDPKWKGRLVIRKSSNIYNKSLVASLIENNGKKAAAEWSKGVVANMARTPKGNDRAQIMAVAAGEADIAVANTYYLALMLSGNKGAEQQAAAKKVKAFFPNQNDRGTHMNISCAALVKGAPNKANAIALVDFLLSPEAQEHFTNNTFEFPMIAGVSPNPLVVNNLGLDFKQDLTTKVSSYGKNQAAALEVMTAAGWK